MNFGALTSKLIETGYSHLESRVVPLRSIDAMDAVRLDGGFSVGPGKHITLAQLNPIWYTWDVGLARENSVFSVRFNFDKSWLTSTILARTRARIIEVFRMDDSEVHIRHAQSFLESLYGQQLEVFAAAAREFLEIPPAPVNTDNPIITRLIRIEEALNLMYSRAILLYFIQKQIPQIRITTDGQYVIWTGWPQPGTGQRFQTTAVLRRDVSRLNMQILNEAFDGRIRDESEIRFRLGIK